MKNHIREMARRGVLQALAGYAVASWFLIEFTSVLAPAFLLPNWTVAAVATLVVLGAFPALLISWRYDLTRDGFVRDTRDVPDELNAFAHRFSIIVIVGLFGATAALWFNYFRALEAGEFDSMYQAQQGAPAISDDGLIRSIAVLPFVDFSPGAGRQLLADGIPEAILHALAQHRELLVTARTSSFFFRDKDVTAAEIGSILGVEALLEGSIQVSDNRLRVTSQLVRTSDQGHIWSNVYEARLDDVFEIQDTIANTVRDLILEKSSASTLSAKAPNPPNLEVYELLIEAKNLLDEQSLDATDRAISLLRLATSLAPDYADAHTWLAKALESKSFILLEHRGATWWSLSDLVEEASAVTDRALELNPDDPVAILLKGFQQQGEPYHDALIRALELAPNDPSALAHIAQLRYQSMMFDEARKHLQRARRVDPGNYESFEMYLERFCGREELTTLVETQLRNYPTSTALGLRLRNVANDCDGLHLDAVTALSRLVRIDTEPGSSVSMLLSLARYGHAEALSLIDDAHRLVPGLFNDMTMRPSMLDMSIYHPGVATGRLSTFTWFAQGPSNPWFFYIPYATLQIELGHYDTATAILDRAQQMWEGFYEYLPEQHFTTETTRIYALQAWLLEQRGDPAAAELAASLLAALQGRRLTEWSEVRDNLLDTPVLVMMLSGQVTEALAWLRDAEADHWTGYQPLVASPVYASLREIPEARDILRRMQQSTAAQLAEIRASGLPEANEPQLLLERIRTLVPPTHQQRALIAAYADHDYPTAAQHFETALAIEEVDPELLAQAAGFAHLLGKHDMGIQLTARRLQMEPESFAAHNSMGFSYFWARDWNSAIAFFERALEINPERDFVHRWIGTAQILKGDVTDGMARIQVVEDDANRLLGLATGHHALGNVEESDAALEDLIAEYDITFAPNIAYIYAYRGEIDLAFEWLDRAIVNGNRALHSFYYQPLFDNLRNDPRWTSTMVRIGIDPAQIAAVEFDVPPLPEI